MGMTVSELREVLLTCDDAMETDIHKDDIQLHMQYGKLTRLLLKPVLVSPPFMRERTIVEIDSDNKIIRELKDEDL